MHKLPQIAVLAADPLVRAGVLALAAAAGLVAAPIAHPSLAASTGAEVIVGPLDDGLVATPLPGLALVADADEALSARRLRVPGVIARDAAPDRVAAAALAVRHGLWVVDPAVDPGAVERFPDEAPPALTPRERDVLALLAEGLSNKEIGRLLEVSPHTAKFHIAALLEKLGAQTRTEAVISAVRLGLVLV